MIMRHELNTVEYVGEPLCMCKIDATQGKFK